MNKMKKILTSVLLIISIMLSVNVINVQADTPEIKLMTCTINETGLIEIYGYIKNATMKSNQITLLITDGTITSSNLTTDSINKIVYIDQRGTANNHAFMFTIQVNNKFSGKDLIITIGNDAGASPIKQILKADFTEFSLNNIRNNDVIYGKDVYRITSSALNAKNVADSIIFGGNYIYYKLNNQWYDLLDKKATDSSFLVPSNALSESTIESWELRYYYVYDEDPANPKKPLPFIN